MNPRLRVGSFITEPLLLNSGIGRKERRERIANPLLTDEAEGAAESPHPAVERGPEGAAVEVVRAFEGYVTSEKSSL